jgi:hypothetical protein
MANGLSEYQANAWLDDLTGSTLYSGAMTIDRDTGANEVFWQRVRPADMAFAAASGGAAVNTSVRRGRMRGGLGRDRVCPCGM